MLRLRPIWSPSKAIASVDGRATLDGSLFRIRFMHQSGDYLSNHLPLGKSKTQPGTSGQSMQSPGNSSGGQGPSWHFIWEGIGSITLEWNDGFLPNGGTREDHPQASSIVSMV